MSHSTTKITPMMAQYLAIKKRHPDHLLFYRMGDFYELFFEDAVKAAAALDIALTKRGKHMGEDIPMCGVPVHSHESYLSRLIKKGFRVAICEQTEDPIEAKKRGAKAVVQREVVRVITPGTLTEDALLEARVHNWLAALAQTGGDMALAWADMSTGAFLVQPVTESDLSAVLARIQPQELLCPQKFLETEGLFKNFVDWKDRLTPQPDARFDSSNAEARLKTFFGVAALEAYGNFSRAELAAAGALLDYVKLTQAGQTPRLSPPSQVERGGIMEIDPATRYSLELMRTLSGERVGSLLSVMDKTVTGAGGRLLAARLAAPLTSPDAINARLDMVQYFHEATELREDVRANLRKSPDLERALSRLVLGRGGPRDLAAIRDGLIVAVQVRDRLLADMSHIPPENLKQASNGLGQHETLINTFSKALAENLPLMARDGGFIAEGYHPKLDELRAMSKESRQLLMKLQGRYRYETGVDSLKIKHNNLLGYFIEVTAKNADRMGEAFIHRQTMANAMRFTTAELADLARDISESGDRALALEQELFTELVENAITRAEAVDRAAKALAELDWATALAELAIERDYRRPLVDDSLAFRMEDGRHPVVEEALRKSGEGTFIPNHCDLGPEQRLWLLTGPNMAGKSTFLRQNALITLLAQMGSFVPAARCHIGVVDRLFSRVGAADDLARGRSTFMVEMVETATILNQATERSLVILDEIGRGTATFDGLSIAWACVEHLHEVNRTRTLFATHYHELNALAERLETLKPHAMRVKEWKGDVVFLHEVIEGAADRSYGVHVARLAGLPAPVVDRAREVLKRLEQRGQTEEAGRGNIRELAEDMPLFQMSAAPSAAPDSVFSEAERALADINPDDLTPREALEKLYELKRLMDSGA